jgi:CubicO group peptidase (beta-lactamase class C family)
MVLSAVSPRSVLHRSLVTNPGTSFYLDPERVVLREVEAPSGGGVASARGIARAYGAFADGGGSLGLRTATIEALMAPPVPSRHGFHDECFGGPAAFSLGFMKPSESFPFGHPGAFGAPGAGGSMGYADPEVGVGYGYVTNSMGMEFNGDPRDVALRSALAEVTG